MWTTQVAVQRLRERLGRALGQQAAAPAASTHARGAHPRQPAAAQPQPQPQHQPQHTFTPIQPAMVPQAAAAAAPGPVPAPAASAPPQPQYYQPVRMLKTRLLFFVCFLAICVKPVTWVFTRRLTQLHV